MFKSSGSFVVMFALCVVVMVALFYATPVLAVFNQIASVLGGL